MQWLSVSARPLFGALGTREAILYTLLDVTDRHRHETALRMRLDSEHALSEFAELLIVEEEPERFLSSAVELIADQFEAPLVTAVAVARDRTEVEPLAVAGPLGRFEPDRWRARCELPVGSATMAAIEAGESIRVADYDARGALQPGADRPFRRGAECCVRSDLRRRRVSRRPATRRRRG